MKRKAAIVFDACVLYPAPLRDLLLELSGHAQDSGWFRAKWSDRIHEEWIENLLKHRIDLTREKLERTRQLMDAHIDDCLVTGYEKRIEKLELPDKDDRHVLAAAIEAGAEIIVTANLKDFPANILTKFGINAVTCDEFFLDFLSTYQEAGDIALTASVMAIQRRLKHPKLSLSEYFRVLETLEGNQLTKTVAHLKLAVLDEPH